MKVLRIVAQGVTTSFRYPHFIHGVHPTFEMPPPSTIYGHICSALGKWMAPEGVRFAYLFKFQAKFHDVEHLHLVSKSSGRLEGTRIAKVLQGSVNPFKREILFNPTLVLYINKPEWYQSFHSPVYPVVLGRSQDLFSYTDIRVVELQTSDKAYFENTLAPFDFGLRAGSGYAVLMPKFLDYTRGRAPTFERYYVLRRRVFSEDIMRIAGGKHKFVVDPLAEEVNGSRLGLCFHSFVGDDDNNEFMAFMA
ncbi:MAG TPA: type I-B CRISPR-associated protein Cas5 [Firmicutes bacterium]|nr:type I-B CRISPR-associated protein Cas5 [Candidatus Fermentithermobacillaceae bacterium]